MAASAILNIMISAATRAGRALTRDFGELENLQISRKGPADFVSSADHKAEKIIVDVLQKARPTYDMLLEESGIIKGTDGQHRWIVDPLDGTTNFLHAFPFFAVNIALERAGEIVASVTYNPVTQELFTAEKGKGAYLNNTRLRVSNRSDLADALICGSISAGGRADPDLTIKQMSKVIPHITAMRNMGSAALELAYVAAGRLDAMYEVGLNIWDMAAGMLLVREAGGLICDLKGGTAIFETGTILASTAGIHDTLKKELRV